MIASSVTAASMPRLPVSWREFSELLQLRTKESMRPSKTTAVLATEAGRLDIRSDQSSNQQDQHGFAAKEQNNSANTSTNQYRSTFNPCDSPPVKHTDNSSEYPKGFEAFA